MNESGQKLEGRYLRGPLVVHTPNRITTPGFAHLPIEATSNPDGPACFTQARFIPASEGVLVLVLVELRISSTVHSRVPGVR